MKIQFIKSLSDIAWDERQPIAKEDYRGKAARVQGRAGRTLMLILPCGHGAILDTWNITDIDTDTPSATPSILCGGNEKACGWHGWLTNGELHN